MTEKVGTGNIDQAVDPDESSLPLDEDLEIVNSKLKFPKWTLPLVVALPLFLAACSDGQEQTDDSQPYAEWTEVSPTATLTPTATSNPTLTPTPTATMTPPPTETPIPTPMPLPEGVPEGSELIDVGVWYRELLLTVDTIEEISPILADIFLFNPDHYNPEQHIHVYTFVMPELCGEFVVTGRNPMGIYQFTSQTTKDFAEENNLFIGFNGGNYQGFPGRGIPVYQVRVADYQLGPLTIYSAGDNINEIDDPNPGKTFFISEKNEVSLFAPIGEPYNGMPGKNRLVEERHGVPTFIESGDGDAHPRTMVALSEYPVSEDGTPLVGARYMYVVIFEGRLEGHASGAYQDQMSAFAIVYLGASWALNLDGGGGSTAVRRYEGASSVEEQQEDRGDMSQGMQQARAGDEAESDSPEYHYEFDNHLARYEDQKNGRSNGTNFGYRSHPCGEDNFLGLEPAR